MTLKKKLGMGIASAVLGAALVGGGTFAFFSDKEVSNNTFATGSLDLAVNPSAIINVENFKPGDTIEKEFKLDNKGTLDIKKVLLKTDYSVEDVKKDNKEDLGKYIKVVFLTNVDKQERVVLQTTLEKLQDEVVTAAENDLVSLIAPEKGIAAGTSDTFKVKFQFIDNNKDQNEFQGDKLQLKWTFEAQQGDGEDKK
ncbi:MULTISPECIES: TasA family protein [Bacillus]|uniref:TasA family protein n=1 Tax=Bacillus TaxID=1386 RepID=UPI0002798FBE|nr:MULTISPECIES: TasA family protein [Bacillus]EJS10531.1 alternate signal-mediated exported protein [Bacillus cereus VDM034]EJS11992.1 alternate signal-mediated exported protein [Bacillus cereus VDM062]MBG9686464.1 cell division protein FtsN [Bacillus mycoides]PRD10145.1 cell division protein FtsN [Bacillus sp. MYb56]QWI21044.1 cell division protein FtsN [Bacillus mycoides]